MQSSDSYSLSYRFSEDLETKQPNSLKDTSYDGWGQDD